ncbi:hypothetical protein MB901379_00167 [Mycobacterium basiliense]|uniref:Secreted protein n=1 Tax=Mycobacterium basiliense TaxID=2094119 RepID=A0A3S4BEM5_9MYCO|nr:hypothetical protein [Mycobacterium basiliense]VDM86645.1 hypothetical protein MB901379_00167 [Mycobacterium basiliense]
MKTVTKLVLFATALALVFTASVWAGAAVLPFNSAFLSPPAAHRAAPTHATHAGDPASVRGLSLSDGDLMLAALTAPTTVAAHGTLSFRIETTAGTPVTRFETENTKQLHLIVVRSDGTQFRHAHPVMSADGQWSIPWTWDAAGTYRVFTDFVSATTGSGTVLSDTLDVGGLFTPRGTPATSTISNVDEFTITLDGTVTTRTMSTVTATVTRGGRRVTTLQPYLGAYGHLVMLRNGDLAYLHAHPDGPAATTGSISGPRISFRTDPPTPGRYLLYLDFQVDQQAHTAQFVIDVGAPADRSPTHH